MDSQLLEEYEAWRVDRTKNPPKATPQEFLREREAEGLRSRVEAALNAYDLDRLDEMVERGTITTSVLLDVIHRIDGELTRELNIIDDTRLDHTTTRRYIA